MTPERNPIPEWAHDAREQDMSWIQENLDIFWESAAAAVKLMGRGALCVDAVSRPLGNQNLFTFFTAEELARFESEHIQEMVEVYEPDEEFVIVLLKAAGMMSTYRVKVLSPLNQTSSLRGA